MTETTHNKAPFITAPRPTEALRDSLFGKVTPDHPPPLRELTLPSFPLEGAPVIFTPHMFHVKAASYVEALFLAWIAEDLIKYVVTVDRSYEPRFIRGIPRTHAHGTAFDINATWNQYGQRPAAFGEPGHIPHALLDIARKMGFWCGTDWLTPAHKHLELTRL